MTRLIVSSFGFAKPPGGRASPLRLGLTSFGLAQGPELVEGLRATNIEFCTTTAPPVCLDIAHFPALPDAGPNITSLGPSGAGACSGPFAAKS